MAPEANEAGLRLICDWGSWIFPFDDMFDCGECRADYRKTEDLLSLTESVFDHVLPGTRVNIPPIIQYHDGIWARIKASAPQHLQERYSRAMRDYCSGVLKQICLVQSNTVPDLEKILSLRRQAVCVRTLYVLVELAHRIDLPDHVVANERISEIETIGIDLTLMHNDIISYRKEEAEGVSHNLVAVCRMNGLSAQDAIDQVGHLIRMRHDSFNKAVQCLPQWDAAIDLEVSRYVAAIRNVVKANLYWSFQSHRFLNQTEKQQFRESYQLTVLRNPHYLNSDYLECFT